MENIPTDIPNTSPIAPKSSDTNLETSELLEKITPQNRLFIMGLVEGKPVFKSYEDAGYKGDYHAAYVLKARLDKELQAFSLAHGVSRGDLMAEISRLNSLPVAASSVSVNQKLKILKLQSDVLKDLKPDAPRITAIQINRFEDGAKKEVVEAKIIDVQPGDSSSGLPDR